MDRYWDREINPGLQKRLREFLSVEELRTLHDRSAGRHFALVAQQTLLLLAVAWVSFRVASPWVWIPLAFFQGFVILGFIILLHEQVHGLIFAHRHPRAERLLGLCYALPSAISATQFKRWHLDHHHELGTTEDDPKRAYLSPRKVKRWYKALYMTPALFVIYSIASGKAARKYEPALRRVIQTEKIVFIGFHLALAAVLWSQAGFGAWFRVHGAPLLLAFPFAFTLNRLGQHYWVDSRDPAKWSTLVRGHWFWDWIFVFSNYHLEHHYLVAVPCYHLPRLQRDLRPFYEKIGWPAVGYGEVLYQWFVKNRVPHTNWLMDDEVAEAAPARR